MKKLISIFAIALASAALFAAAMDSKVRAVSAATMELVFTNPKEGLPLVVKSLTANTSGTAARVKVLHDWICDNIAYDTDMYFLGRGSNQDYESVLKNQKAVCSGYCRLMIEMCRLAGIEAIGIGGYSKGFGYRGKIGSQTDHEWNAVNIGGRWQLIDVTWDAGYVDYRTFIKRYSTQWLNRTPEQFIYSHLPADDQYQYLKEIKTKEQFEKEPYIAGIFFDYGLSLEKNAPDYTNEIAEAVQYEFRLSKTSTAVMSDLVEKSKGSVKNATWVDRIGNRITLDVDIPSAKKYEARLFARNRTEDTISEFYSVAEFEGLILPKARQLVEQKKVTQNEYDFFEQSYFKVRENNRYYFAEDLFATARNNAVRKILKALEKTGSYKEVLSVEVVAADGYAGYGEGVLRFPSAYRSYSETANTHIISPVSGTLEKGSVQKFEVETKDYSAIGVVIDGSIVAAKKNAQGVFELEITVPEDVDEIAVYGTKNGKNYSGLWYYQVE